MKNIKNFLLILFCLLVFGCSDNNLVRAIDVSAAGSAFFINGDARETYYVSELDLNINNNYFYDDEYVCCDSEEYEHKILDKKKNVLSSINIGKKKEIYNSQIFTYNLDDDNCNYIKISPNMNYVNIIQKSNDRKELFIDVEDRTTPLDITFDGVNIYTPIAAPVLFNYSTQDINIYLNGKNKIQAGGNTLTLDDYNKILEDDEYWNVLFSASATLYYSLFLQGIVEYVEITKNTISDEEGLKSFNKHFEEAIMKEYALTKKAYDIIENLLYGRDGADGMDGVPSILTNGSIFFSGSGSVEIIGGNGAPGGDASSIAIGGAYGGKGGDAGTALICENLFVNDNCVVDFSSGEPGIGGKGTNGLNWNANFSGTSGGKPINYICEKEFFLNSHTFSNVYSFNDTHHWYAATCEHLDLKKGLEEHVLIDGSCAKCNFVKNMVEYVDGLKLALSSNGKSYEVIGIVELLSNDVFIPSIYKGLPVTSVGDFAFFDYQSIESITIPDSVTHIGEGAFNYCRSLKNILMGSGVSYIGEGAFQRTAIKTMIIPDSVTFIGDYAFNWCENLQSIVIPNSVLYLGEKQFYKCNSLKELTIPFVGRNVDSDENATISEMFGGWIPNTIKKITITKQKEIPNFAFSKCESLESIVFINEITEIGNYAFDSCLSIKNITIPNSIISIGEGAFRNCSSLESIILPRNIDKIPDYAFEGCSSLESISIPENVISIGLGAFSGCISLKSIEILEGVLNIGDYAFNDMPITNIRIPDSVTTIGNYAFQGCSLLDTIILGEGIAIIEDWAFNGCAALKNIYYKGSREQWNSISVGGNNEYFAHAKVYYNCDSE